MAPNQFDTQNFLTERRQELASLEQRKPTIVNQYFTRFWDPFTRLYTAAEIFQLQVQEVPILTIQSPETRQLIIGGFTEEAPGTHRWQPARLHLGVERSHNTTVFMYQAFNTELVLSVFDTYRPEQIMINPLAREGLYASSHNALFLAQLPQVASIYPLDVSHKGVGEFRTASPVRGKTDLFKKVKDRREVECAIIVDSIAGGLNGAAATHHLRDRFPNLRKIVFIAPFATAQGSRALFDYAKRIGVEEIDIVACHDVLWADPQDWYGVWYPQMPLHPPEIELLRIMYGDHAQQFCLGGDFTSAHTEPEQALRVLDLQLQAAGLSLGQLKATSIQIRTVEDIGFTYEQFLPSSTHYKRAWRTGQKPYVGFHANY